MSKCEMELQTALQANLKELKRKRDKKEITKHGYRSRRGQLLAEYRRVLDGKG